MSYDKTVTPCPSCKDSYYTGLRMKNMNDLGWRARTFTDITDFTKCEMCEGSGLVFVVPAVVIGPAPLRPKVMGESKPIKLVDTENP